jgi:hypothetical protein
MTEAPNFGAEYVSFFLILLFSEIPWADLLAQGLDGAG